MSDSLNDQFDDLLRQREKQQKRFYARRPKQIGNLIAQVVQRRGYAQVRAASQRDQAWQQAVGDLAESTQLGSIRRATLEVIVANSLLMQELTFRKEELIKKLNAALPETEIKQLKFRVGQIK